MKIIVRIIVSLLIFILAVASVANIHTRAVQLHADGGWQTWGISIGFAVSFALFSYLLIASRKAFFFIAAGFGAAVTGIMQTGMYLALGSDWFTALSFGCGAPILEALLAMAEHYIDEPAKKQASNPLLLRLGNAVASRIERPTQSANATQPERKEKAQPERKSATQSVTDALPSFALQAQAMQANGMSIEEIATQLRRSKRSVNNYLAQAKALRNGHDVEATAQ